MALKEQEKKVKVSHDMKNLPLTNTLLKKKHSFHILVYRPKDLRENNIQSTLEY